MKKFKKNNKGFSLVELIVVVAIMAVLMGILVPVLVQNVEKSKRQKDISAVEEIRSTMVVELASPKYSNIKARLTYNSGTINITNPSTTEPSTLTSDISAFLSAVMGDLQPTVTLSSGAYKNCNVTFTIKDGRVDAFIGGNNIKDLDYENSSIATSAAEPTLAP